MPRRKNKKKFNIREVSVDRSAGTYEVLEERATRKRMSWGYDVLRQSLVVFHEGEWQVVEGIDKKPSK